MDLVIEGGSIPRGNEWVRTEIGIEHGQIVELSSKRLEGRRRFDAQGAWVFPGMIDTHVHFREPGRTDKEDFGTGTAAAARGGITTVLEIQNNEPLMTDLAVLAAKHAQIAPKARVNYGLYANIGVQNLPELGKLASEVVAFKVFMTQSVGPLTVTGVGDLWKAFAAVAKTGKPLAVHAESDTICKIAREGLPDHVSSHVSARPRVAEWVAVAEAIELARDTGVWLHLPHLSTARAVELVAEARQSGMRISAATCPHYLVYTADDVARGGNVFKVNPPIKLAEDRTGLLRGLESGVIDHVHSDHAPHTPAEKGGAYTTAPSGIADIEHQFLMLYQLYREAKLSLSALVRATATAPAAAFSLGNRGQIEKGAPADFVIVDPGQKTVVAAQDLVTKAQNSPSIGRTFDGRLRATIVDGHLVAEDGRLLDVAAFGRRIA